jgi:CubicO group peptidase (beta-lactamase class C family)
MLIRTSALIFSLTLAGAPLALANPEIIYPKESWEITDAHRLRTLEFSQLEQFLFPDNPGEKAPQTDAVVIIKSGRIIYERYANNYGPEKRHPFWSVSKSVFSAIYGAALGDGKLKNEDSICLRIPKKDPKICAIRNIDLIQHSSGLEWAETYENSKRPKDSSVIAMLYGGGTKDVADFVLALHPPKFAPGTQWNYSSGDSNLLAGVLRLALGDTHQDYPWTRIFAPIGIRSFLWERDEKGTLVASSYLHGTARDLARFGLLFLREGKWEGKEILSKEWIRLSLSPAPAIKTTKPDDRPGREPNMFGAHWWLNFANPSQNEGKPWPNQPETTYAALGHWGQSIVILPEEDLVVVRLANDRGDRFSMDRFLTLVREYAR